MPSLLDRLKASVFSTDLYPHFTKIIWYNEKMNTQDVLDPQRWAETTFGGVLLHDLRRTRRAVTAATHIAKDASTSRPSQMQRRKKVKAVYRLLDEPDVTFEGLM